MDVRQKGEGAQRPGAGVALQAVVAGRKEAAWVPLREWVRAAWALEAARALRALLAINTGHTAPHGLALFPVLHQELSSSLASTENFRTQFMYSVLLSSVALSHCVPGDSHAKDMPLAERSGPQQWWTSFCSPPPPALSSGAKRCPPRNRPPGHS